jgi:hypothetical protein
MAINYPGPYENRIFYTVDTNPGGPITHQFRYSMELKSDPDPGDAYSTIDVVLSGGGDLALHTSTLAVVNVLEDLLAEASSTIDYAELWRYTPGTFDAQYITSYAIELDGQHPSGPVAAMSLIFTFRTTAGGIMKCVLLDVPGDNNVPVTYNELSGALKEFVDYVKHPNNSPFLARDGGRPFVNLKTFSGQNEAIFKRRFGR